MDDFKELMGLAWSLGKYYFTNSMETPEDYSKYADKAKELLQTQKPGTKEYCFVRRLLSAVNEYTDADWREKHNGVQTSLFDLKK